MRHVHVVRDIEAAPSDVWRFLARFEYWPVWGTSIREVASDVETIAPGVTGRVKTVAGVWLPFEITDVRRELSWQWKVAGFPATRHTMAPLGPSRTRVDFSVAWPLAPYVVVLRAALRALQELAEQP